MKTCLVSLLFFIFTGRVLAQESSCVDSEFRARVIAKSGLNLRSEPHRNAKTLRSLPYWGEIKLCPEKVSFQFRDTIDGFVGFWRLLEYQGTEGYAFDAFLLHVGHYDTLHIATKDYRFSMEFGNCSDINFDPNLHWFGVYRMDGFDTIMPVNIEVVNPNARIVRGYDDGNDWVLRTQYSDSMNALFLIGFKNPVAAASEHRGQHELSWLYPGQIQHVNTRNAKRVNGKHSFELIAAGTVKKVQYCPELENYRMFITDDRYNGHEQDMLPYLKHLGECGMPMLYWFGDIDGDSRPDMVFQAGSNYMVEYTLFLSSLSTGSNYVGKADQWASGNCH
jgi:hypothetical protein